MKYVTIIFLIISVNGYSQLSHGNINSGGQTSHNFSFAVGEIFVIEVQKNEDETSFLSVTLYPNPVSSIAFIEIEGILKNKKIQIYSITGRLIYSGVLVNSKINFSDISQGFYFIKSESNEFKPIKIIKN